MATTTTRTATRRAVRGRGRAAVVTAAVALFLACFCPLGEAWLQRGLSLERSGSSLADASVSLPATDILREFNWPRASFPTGEEALRDQVADIAEDLEDFRAGDSETDGGEEDLFPLEPLISLESFPEPEYEELLVIDDADLDFEYPEYLTAEIALLGGPGGIVMLRGELDGLAPFRA